MAADCGVQLIVTKNGQPVVVRFKDVPWSGPADRMYQEGTFGDPAFLNPAMAGRAR